MGQSKHTMKTTLEEQIANQLLSVQAQVRGGGNEFLVYLLDMAIEEAIKSKRIAEASQNPR